jgi:hypothetical protein
MKLYIPYSYLAVVISGAIFVRIFSSSEKIWKQKSATRDPNFFVKKNLE